MLDEFTLKKVEEKDRKNVRVSSLLISRAPIFYPAKYYSNEMKEVMKKNIDDNGGASFDSPLVQYSASVLGKEYNISLHGNFLLQSHREIFDSILACGDIVRMLPEDVVQGKELTWGRITEAFGELKEDKSMLDEFSLAPNDVAIGISLYDLCMAMNFTPHKTKYKDIADKLLQLSTSHISIEELDNDSGEINSIIMLSFLKTFRLFRNESLLKNKKKLTGFNYVIIIVDESYKKILKESPYLFREQQKHLRSLNGTMLKGFVKMLLTHDKNFLESKPLAWFINSYTNQMKFGNTSRMSKIIYDEVMEHRDVLLNDFNLMLEVCGNYPSRSKARNTNKDYKILVVQDRL